MARMPYWWLYTATTSSVARLLAAYTDVGCPHLTEHSLLGSKLLGCWLLLLLLLLP
jgi:hypothetical protein